MAMKTKPKNAKKKSVKKTFRQPAVSGRPFKLQKLMDNLEAMEPTFACPCRAALARVKNALTDSDAIRLRPELALLDKAVADCPNECGCRQGLSRAVISIQGKMLGELTSEDGKFSGLVLNGAGEDLLGEEAATLRYVGLKDVPGFSPSVQARDQEFLEAFSVWCGEKGCEVLVLSEPYLPVWSKLQEAKLEDGELLPLMNKLRTVQPFDALRLVDGLAESTDARLC